MQNIYLLRQNPDQYFGYKHRGVVFAFKSKRHAEYVKKHIRYDGNHVERIVLNKYLLKTHFNNENNFADERTIDQNDLCIERKRLYDLLLTCNVNRVSLRIVETILDLENGDLEMNVDFVKYRLPVDESMMRFNLEIMYESSTDA